MTLSDCLALLGVIVGMATAAWAVCSWALDKKFENDKKIENLKKENQAQTTTEIKTLILDLKHRMMELEVLQTNLSSATMKQFHALELSMKDYSKDIGIHAEQIRQQRAEIEKLWKTIVTEIAPGVFRVSDKK